MPPIEIIVRWRPCRTRLSSTLGTLFDDETMAITPHSRFDESPDDAVFPRESEASQKGVRQLS
jgi:hypothetical protein